MTLGMMPQVGLVKTHTEQLAYSLSTSVKRLKSKVSNGHQSLRWNPELVPNVQPATAGRPNCILEQNQEQNQAPSDLASKS